MECDGRDGSKAQWWSIEGENEARRIEVETDQARKEVSDEEQGQWRQGL